MTTDCAEVLDHLWEFLDAELTTEYTADTLRHVGGCTPCRQAAAFDRAFLDLIRRQRSCIAAGHLVWQVRVAIRATAL